MLSLELGHSDLVYSLTKTIDRIDPALILAVLVDCLSLQAQEDYIQAEISYLLCLSILMLWDSVLFDL
jgi:hypothetical protein